MNGIHKLPLAEIIIKMSIMRQKLGARLFNSARSASRMAATNDLTDNWLRRINDTATTGDAKDAHSQL